MNIFLNKQTKIKQDIVAKEFKSYKILDKINCYLFNKTLSKGISNNLNKK